MNDTNDMIVKWTELFEVGKLSESNYAALVTSYMQSSGF
eukprot:COSAG02_NODE_15355_length_1178_cov_12.194625_1_plen_38_part_01